MNGGSNGGLLAHADLEGAAWDSSSVGRLSPQHGLQPLNLEPSSAPVPGSEPRASSLANSAALGRATSSRKCILVAVFVAVTTIALGVGLGVGLGSSSSDSTSSSSGGTSDGGSTGQAQTSVTVFGASLPQPCQELATGDYWAAANITRYALALELTEEMLQYSQGGVPPTAFSATAKLNFTVQGQPVGCMVLNARNLTFSSVGLSTRQDDGTYSPLQPVCGGDAAACAGGAVSPQFERRGGADAAGPLSTGDRDLVAVALPAQLPVGTIAVLDVAYTGLLGSWPTDGLGLFRSAPFPAADGETMEVLLGTQGETTGARMLLPCYDSPARKAVFSVEMTVPTLTPAGTDTVALSNMPVRSRVGGSDDAVQQYTFEDTPLMSPYLLAVAVGDLVQYGTNDTSSAGTAVADPGGEGIPLVRLWAAPGLEGQLAAAAAAAPAAFRFYTDYFGVALPPELTKMDLVAVPGRTGAMENWGLLLFDERRLLHDPAWEGAYSLKLMADVVCHEVAHQWLGNLGTKQDWTQLSVDEGLASFVEYKCLETLQEFEGQGDVHFFRGSTPQLQAPGVHEAPGFAALQYGADPTQPPMVSPNDLDGGTGGYMQYSKPAALVHSHERYLRELTGGEDVMRGLLQAMLRQAAFSTWNWSMYIVGANATLTDLAATSLQAAGLVTGLEARAGTFMRAQSYDEVMGIIRSGVPTMATWFYSPLYPIVSLDEAPDGSPTVTWEASPPGVAAGDAVSVALFNYNASLFAFGAASHPFCAYPLDQETAAQLGAEDVYSQLAPLCDIPTGRRYFPTTIAVDNLTACSSSGNHAGSWSTRWGELVLAEPPTWVDNQDGARLMRSVYNQTHFDALVAVLASMSSVCSGDGANATCCAGQSDLLEGAAFLNDILALAQTGHQEPLAAGYTAARAVQAVEAAVYQGGSPDSGLWQYLIGRAALDNLLIFSRYAEWLAEDRPGCVASMNAYIRRVMRRTADWLDGEWLGASTPQDDTLKQLIGARLMWPLAMVQTEPLLSNLCIEYTGSPLWQRVLDAASGGPGDAGVRVGPGGVADEAPRVPPDLLPAAYMVGAALPGTCNATLLGEPGVPEGLELAELAPATAAAIQRCYLADPSHAEAIRCLYALPLLAALSQAEDFQAQPGESPAAAAVWDGAVGGALPWLLQTSGNATRACEPFLDDPPVHVRCLRRATDLPPELPALFNFFSRVSPAHFAATLGFLERSFQVIGPSACTLLASTERPSTQAGYTQLTNMLTSGPGSVCPPAVKLRIAGQAAQAVEVMEEQAGAMCDYVENRLSEWAAQDAAAAG